MQTQTLLNFSRNKTLKEEFYSNKNHLFLLFEIINMSILDFLNPSKKSKRNSSLFDKCQIKVFNINMLKRERMMKHSIYFCIGLILIGTQSWGSSESFSDDDGGYRYNKNTMYTLLKSPEGTELFNYLNTAIKCGQRWGFKRILSEHLRCLPSEAKEAFLKIKRNDVVYLENLYQSWNNGGTDQGNGVRMIHPIPRDPERTLDDFLDELFEDLFD
jgi:hypothetical protein